MSYLDTVNDLYREAAENPQIGMCCTTTPAWQFPGLKVTDRMLEMNYGCGTTVHPRDLSDDPVILYIGVGGGMELLQFAYFTRSNGAVIGVDSVDTMLESCRTNLKEAESLNGWFEEKFVELRKGNALDLPAEDNSIDIVAQNCLFNIFMQNDLQTALRESFRVLKPHGKLIMSDPVCEVPIPDQLRNNEQLRAECLSGAIPLREYLKLVTDIGFGTVEVRAKRPYRILSAKTYDLEENIYIESVEICAVKDPVPKDGPCIFTGKNAIYFGNEDYFDDHRGHVLTYNQPLSVCDKTARALGSLDEDILITPSTWFYDGGGCC